MIRNWRYDDFENAGEHGNFACNVKKWAEHGQTSFDLCFAMVEGGEIVGGIAYLANESEPAEIVDFTLSHNSFHLGAELITRSMESLSLGSACYHLYNDGEFYDRYRQCFIEAGFITAQEKLSYRFTGELPGCDDSGIVYRTLAEAGEEAFIEAVAIVTRQTLDRADFAETAIHGETEAAGDLVAALKDIDHQPGIWALAYRGDRFIGLVIPSNFGDAYDGKLGAINYIGVPPDERGKGYVDILLAKGTRLLVSQGVATVIADIDVLNYPMKNALERCGYVIDCEEAVLEKSPVNVEPC